MLHFHIITLFPESIQSYLSASILGRAQESKKIKISFYNPKDVAGPERSRRVVKTRTQDIRVDRKPYGGGPGMVLRPEPMLKAVALALKKAAKSSHSRGLPSRISNKPEVVFFSTDGKVFDESMAKKFSKKKDVVLICGHYEGVDARVQKILKAKKVSVGPYVLTGGELPAATLIDAIARHVPGVLGKAESLEASRVSSPEVYTRPEVLEWKGKKYRVPKVLLTGHHAKIEEWKKKKRETRKQL